jgi:integrase
MRIEDFKDPVTKRKRWRADFTCAGARHKPVADTKDELYDIIEAIRKRARAAKYDLPVEREVVLLGQLVEERKKDFSTKRKSHRMIISVIEKFCAHLGETQAVDRINTQSVRSFVQALRLINPDLSSTTVNGYLNQVNALLHKAGSFFPALETWKPPRMPFEDESRRGRERVITEEEQARLFYELRAPAGFAGGANPKHKRREKPEEVRTRHMAADILELSLMTGMRKTEVRTLTKTKLDLTVRTFSEGTIYGFIQLPPTSTKTNEPRRIPLNWEARQILERRCAESNCAWVFPNVEETGPISETVVWRVLKRIAERAKLPYGRKLEDGFIFHDSRHTAATRMLEGGAHIKTVGQILGHTDETMTMRYAHTNYRSLAHAVASLGNGTKKGSNAEEPVKIPVGENEGDGK